MADMHSTDDQGLRDDLVSGLQRAVARGAHGFEDVPPALRIVLESESWKERPVRARGDETVRFLYFEEFVAAPLPDGLGIQIETLKDLCRSDVELRNWIDEAVKRPDGKPPLTVYNIHSLPRPSGTSADRALRKLREDAGPLHARVLAGELSPHAAMVEAGFRPKTITVRLSPEAFARAAVKHLTDSEIDQLVTLLEGGAS